jgi:HD-like signal output (HDOD) protein
MLRWAVLQSSRLAWNDKTFCPMKKQICFAGFAESEIDCLNPALAKISQAWRSVFLPDAIVAAAKMVEEPFDAVIANLRAGGVTADELPRLASARRSHTLLFVLGDVTDREQTINCLGTAHQFISRPWKPNELIPIVERSLALDAWLSTDKLRSFVPRLGRLPGLSATYFEVIKKIESPHASVESVAEIIARDPTLTARLLQVVNSPACGLNEKVTRPADAVSILGLDMVKSIVLCLQMFASSAPAPLGTLSLDQLWRHSFQVARLANKIVLRSTGGDRMAADAYTAGLLHRVGQIVLVNNLSNEYAAVLDAARDLHRPLHEVELDKLGVTHNQVGAYLLGVWGLPLPLVEAVALYPTPGLTTMPEFSLLTAVHVADVLAQEEEGCADGIPMPKLDREYLATLDLPDKTAIWRKALSNGLATPVSKAPARPGSSAAPAAGKPRRPSASLLVLTAAVVGALAVVMLRPYFIPAPTPQSAPVPKPPETPAADTVPAPVAPAASASPFDSIKIQGIIYRADHPVALINGRMLDTGARINGAEIINIGPSQVTLAYAGKQKVFKLK